MTAATPTTSSADIDHESRSTFSALRSGNFRLYFVGQLISLSGTWMQNIAQGYLVFSLTHSEAYLGLVALAAGLPQLLMSPVAGVILERIPRRRLMLMTQTIQMILAFILTALTATNTVQVWHILVLAFLLGMTNTVDAPARQTFVLEMVGREDLHSGIALNSILNSLTRVLGPTAAGIALLQFGVVWCFFLNGVSFLAVIFSLLIMKVPYEVPPSRSEQAALRQLREGLHYVRGNSTVLPLLLMTACVGFFVVPIIQILPALADEALHSPDRGYAILSASQGIGSVLGGLVAGMLAALLGRGRTVAVSILLGGVATIGMAYQLVEFPAGTFSALTGFFLVVLVVHLNTLIQTTVPDAFRGRVMSLYTLGFLGLAPFGAVLLGGISELIGTSNGVALYGLLGGLSGALVLLRWRSILSLRD